MTLISDAWLGDGQSPCGCGPGPAAGCPLTSFPARSVALANPVSSVHGLSWCACAGHDPTLSCSTLLQWLTPFLGGDTVTIIQVRALGWCFYLSPWPGCENTYLPTKSQRQGLSWRTSYVPQKTVLIGRINEGAVTSKTKKYHPITCKGLFCFPCPKLGQGPLARAAFTPLPKPKVWVVTLLCFLERFSVKLPPEDMDLKIITAVIASHCNNIKSSQCLLGARCWALYMQGLIQSSTQWVGGCCYHPFYK